MQAYLKRLLGHVDRRAPLHDVLGGVSEHPAVADELAKLLSDLVFVSIVRSVPSRKGKVGVVVLWKDIGKLESRMAEGTVL